eukprot:scaffold48_cov311-Pinguiococcus_pyrenoidosus.AAC.259
MDSQAQAATKAPDTGSEWRASAARLPPSCARCRCSSELAADPKCARTLGELENWKKHSRRGS